MRPSEKYVLSPFPKQYNKEIDLVINTTKTQHSIRDSYSIRRTSLMNNIPYYTTMAGAKVAVNAIEVLKNNMIEQNNKEKETEKG